MNGLSGYWMRIICAAILCAWIPSVAGSNRSILRLITGMFLTLTVLSPLGKLELPEPELRHLQSEAESAVRTGVEQADEMREELISEALEAYIWNEAAELGLEITACLRLDEEGLPASVTLTGDASELQRQELTETIVRELGLEREDVIWNNPYQSSA